MHVHVHAWPACRLHGRILPEFSRLLKLEGVGERIRPIKLLPERASASSSLKPNTSNPIRNGEFHRFMKSVVHPSPATLDFFRF